MKRTDIEIIVRKSSATILSKNNQITYSSCNDKISLFSTADFSTKMLDEIESSKIVEIENYEQHVGSGCALIMHKKFGYCTLKLQDVLLDIVEKYEL